MPRRSTASRTTRLILLLVCFLLGLGIGIVGSSLTGNSAWYAAIPAVIAVGWLFVANPDECDCNRRPTRRD